MLRPISLLMLSALAACATAGSTPPERQFVLADTGKYKTEAEKQRAALIAQNDCKVKAMTASAAIEKSITSERNGMENLSRAREKGAEMYTSSFTLCMLNAGFTQR
ncbi:MAG TPA: hypothetical protein VNR65_17775 [Geobacterales bacterium]|nr:hypothetical protein [Geobacterales bacterium]